MKKAAGEQFTAESTVSRPASSTASRLASRAKRNRDTGTSASTPAPTPKITTTTKTTTQKYFRPFEYKGNIDADVQRAISGYGDGDIGSKKGGKTYASLEASLSMPQDDIVRLDLTYTVWEKNFDPNKQNNQDKLYFNASKDIYVGDFLHEAEGVKDDGVTKVTTTSKLQLDNTDKFFIKDYFSNESKNYKNVATDSFPDENKTTNWMSLGSLYFKVDGDGNELKDEGNIAVKGEINFSVLRVDTIVTEEIPLDRLEEVYAEEAIYGDGNLNEELPDTVLQVLGHGYDITGKYADSAYVKNRVFDMDKLVEKKMIIYAGPADAGMRYESGEGARDYAQHIEDNLEIKGSGSLYGFSFSSETSKSFKKDVHTNEGYRLVKERRRFNYGTYKIDNSSVPQSMKSFLTDLFIQDLDKLPTAKSFVEKYGTHVLFGMMLGARLDYTFSYRKSLKSISTATTLSTVNSVSWDGGVVNKKEEDKDKKQNLYEIFEERISKGEQVDPDTILALYLLKTATESGDKSKADTAAKEISKKLGFELSASYSESESTAITTELSSTDVTFEAIGGDLAKTWKIGLNPTNEDIGLWADTIPSFDKKFIDFLDKTVIPISDLIPTGHKLTADSIQAASIEYQKEQYILKMGNDSFTPTEYERGWYESENEFTTVSRGNTKRLNGYDGDVYSQKGKQTEWQVDLELINFDDGSCGCAVSLIVSEGGSSTGGTQLQNTAVINVPKWNLEQMVINTSVLYPTYATTFRAIGTVNRNVCNEWLDITEYFDGSKGSKCFCPFLETRTHRLYIKIDGSGHDDQGNIGVRGYLRIPYVGYGNAIEK